MMMMMMMMMTIALWIVALNGQSHNVKEGECWEMLPLERRF